MEPNQKDEENPPSSLQEPLLSSHENVEEEVVFSPAPTTTREVTFAEGESSPNEATEKAAAPATPGLVDSSMYEQQQQQEDYAQVPIQLEPLPEEILGEEQAPVYRDEAFAILFLAQLAAVFGTAIWLGPQALTASMSGHDGGSSNSTNSTLLWSAESRFVEYYYDSVSVLRNESDHDHDDDDSSNDLDMLALVTLLVVTPVLAMVFTLLVLDWVVTCSKSLVTVSFFASPLCWLVAAGLLALVDTFVSENDDGTDERVLAVGSLLSLALLSALVSLIAYCCYRRHVPFAAVNLKVAVSAIRVHRGLFLVSFATLLATYAWFLIWFLALMGVSHHAAMSRPQVPCHHNDTDNDPSGSPDDTDDDLCDAPPPAWMLVLLAVSFYWTHQVLKNLLHTTTAGAVGSWWFGPPASPSCCSMEVYDSWARAATYSLGSICFGSLVVAVLRPLQFALRDNGRRGDNLCSCVLECIVGLLRRLVEYMNVWAFVYVGLYGYDFLTSGKKVITLFRFRGWTTIITDLLVFRVVRMLNVGIAALTGGAAAVVDAALGPILPDTPGTSHFAAFGIGFFVGLVLSSTAVFVVNSAVRTIMVCFAERPTELAEQYPDLYSDMIHAWTKVYPDVFQQDTTDPATIQQERQEAEEYIDEAFAAFDESAPLAPDAEQSQDTRIVSV